ncbi:hypothetical protein L596_010456 [Steinernema carpocapsae]|uniref:Uncharacterized protein n=1 Tax=Steinernema carpocapsae TaxID=34508 RepID=A0A4U5PJ49_STECR|nr:hypothetical protein L596_010456 [Steinernema carpocapsae]
MCKPKPVNSAKPACKTFGYKCTSLDPTEACYSSFNAELLVILTFTIRQVRMLNIILDIGIWNAGFEAFPGTNPTRVFVQKIAHLVKLII